MFALFLQPLWPPFSPPVSLSLSNCRSSLLIPFTQEICWACPCPPPAPPSMEVFVLISFPISFLFYLLFSTFPSSFLLAFMFQSDFHPNYLNYRISVIYTEAFTDLCWKRIDPDTMICANFAYDNCASTTPSTVVTRRLRPRVRLLLRLLEMRRWRRARSPMEQAFEFRVVEN